MGLVGDAVGQRSAVALLVEGRETNVFAFEDLGGTSLVIVTRSAAGGAAEDLSQGACHRRLLCDVENYWWCHGGLRGIMAAESFFCGTNIIIKARKSGPLLPAKKSKTHNIEAKIHSGEEAPRLEETSNARVQRRLCHRRPCCLHPPQATMSIEARDHDDVPDDDSAAEIEEDLLTLKAMDIEHDFNSWSDFRSTLSVTTERDSLASLFSRSSIVYKATREASEISEVSISIAEDDVNDNEEDDTFDYASGSGSDGNHVSFSSLSPGERRDIRAWNIRLSRDTVFSRYYFPEQWELRELKTIEKFLDLINNEVQCMYVSFIQQVFVHCF